MFVYMMVIAICLHMQICSCVEKLTLVLTILLFNTSFVSHLLILGKKTKLYYWLLIVCGVGGGTKSDIFG